MISAGLTIPIQNYLVQTPMLPAFPGYDSVSDAYRNVLLARVLLYNAGYTDIIIDSDHDGWSDYDEIYTIFTDPFNPGPFLIKGDAQLEEMAAYHEWDGDGSEEYPYIIEGYYIDVNDVDISCIEIWDIVDTYFIIRDCEVTGASGPYAELVIPFVHARSGIFLNNTPYAEVTNNLVYGNCYGIRIDESYAVTISDNTCHSNNWEGIAVIMYSTHCTVTNNYCYNNYNPDGIVGNGIGVGIGAYENTIVHNFAYDNQHSGIHSFLGYDNTIIDNDCYGNYWGIAVRGTSSGNDILDNDCWDNYQGIYIHNSDSNTVADNDCFSNDLEGIVVVGDSTLNTVTDNWCYDNVANGIGVGLGATGNTIENNHAYNNGYAGIHFWNGDDNTVSGNECYDNAYGISMRGQSSGNDILENIITSNDVGIYLFEGSSNTIFHNSFIDNTVQAFDEDPISENFWYHPELLRGNIWSCYIGVDFDGDGIGDTDIPWPGEGYDLYPLVTDDFDGDGISYYGELVLGTDPYDPDTDFDGFSDSEEWRVHFTEPTVPGPFYIVGDAQLLAMALHHGWYVDGVIIIQGYEIDVDDADISCIEVRDIYDTYFIIRDCTLTGSTGPNYVTEPPYSIIRAGIYLFNVDGAEVTNNLCHDNLEGICLNMTTNCLVEENECYGNTYDGIIVCIWSYQNDLVENYCHDNGWDGIIIAWGAEENTALRNNCSLNGRSGITLVGWYGVYGGACNNDV
jgi:parallel beta-helix repeat protein